LTTPFLHTSCMHAIQHQTQNLMTQFMRIQKCKWELRTMELKLQPPVNGRKYETGSNTEQLGCLLRTRWHNPEYVPRKNTCSGAANYPSRFSLTVSYVLLSFQEKYPFSSLAPDTGRYQPWIIKPRLPCRRLLSRSNRCMRS
jgi:hypothetical protein